MTGVIGALAAVVWAVGAGTPGLDAFEDGSGPENLAMVSGFGGLTVGVNGRGTVSVCRWPGPGHPDQIGYTAMSPADALGPRPDAYGLVWGVEIDGRVRWLNDPEWEFTQHYGAATDTVMVTQAHWPGSELIVTEHIFVLPRRDVFVSRVIVEGTDSPPAFYWYADFTPCTRHLPELPVADWLLDGLNDFAAFADPVDNIVVHFRPKNPGRESWAHARRLAANRAPIDQWRAFDDGVWIGYAGAGGLGRALCAANEESPGQALNRLRQSGPGRSAATGPCYSIAEVGAARHGKGYTASVTVAFAERLDKVEALLDQASGRPAERLEAAARTRAEAFLDSVRLPRIDDARVRGHLHRALLTILTATDRGTGSTVRSPASQPPLARDWAREGAWVIYALDLSGRQDDALRHIRFYLDHVRDRYARGKPLGTLPMSTYTDGVESSPHLVVDDEGVARLLWAIQLHGQLLSARERTRFYRSVWDRVNLCTEFLVGWSDSRRGAPLWSADPISLRDLRTRERLYAAKLGLDSALAIALSLGEHTPDAWARRSGELDALLRWVFLDGLKQWDLDEALPPFLEEFADLDAPGIRASILKRLNGLEELQGVDAARALCEVALAWKSQPWRLRTLRPYVEPALQRALTRPPTEPPKADGEPAMPDTLAAALAVVAVHTIYPPAK